MSRAVPTASGATRGERPISPPGRLLVALALCGLGACASSPSSRSPETATHTAEPALGAALVGEPTLYDDLGGEEGVHALVEQFIRAIAADERIRGRYRHTDIARFHTMVGLQMCALTGGGCLYTGEDMHAIHHGMQIHPSEFNAIVEALMKAMDQRGLPVTTQNRLLAIYAPLRDDIIDH